MDVDVDVDERQPTIPRVADGAHDAPWIARSDRALQGLAALLTLSVLAAALHDVSYAWDVWYYHLPFAARIVGVVTDDSFVFHAANEARYAGMPLFGELCEGLLFRLTGRPECASLVSFACLPVFAWFLRRRFGVPVHLTLLGLFAIPLVQAHATSCYVDLLANTAVSVLVLLAIQAHAAAPSSARGLTLRTVDDGALAMGLVAAGVAVNTKVLAQPIVVVALLALGARAAPELARQLPTPARAKALRAIAALVVAMPLVFFTPLKNLVAYQNPFYPTRTSILGVHLPGAEDPYSSSPPYLQSAPEPVRFALSVVEVGVRPLTDRRRWSVDQWMAPDSAGPRMGGFFGAYALAELAMLGARVARSRTRKARAAAGGFALLTAVTCVMPQAHELRYYLAWMVVLVALNRWLACDGSAPGRSKLLAGAVSTAALAVVIVVTRGVFAYPSGSTFAELLAEKVDPRVLGTVAPGERVCVRDAPWNLLWAPTFHGPKRYVLKEAEEPGDCAGYRPLQVGAPGPN